MEPFISGSFMLEKLKAKKTMARLVLLTSLHVWVEWDLSVSYSEHRGRYIMNID